MDILNNYKKELINQELQPNTIKKYINDIKAFESFRGNKDYSKDLIINYKDELLEKYKTSTVNNKIVILNKYLKFIDKDNLTVKVVKVQRGNELENVLTQKDFERIYRQAEQKGTQRDITTLDILYSMGVRVSEVEFVTVEAVKKGYSTIDNKGKIRRVPITKALQKKLKKYCKDNNIETGSIILNRNGKPLSRYYIYKRLKYLGGQARVKKSKVYPHSIRHLFAKNWLAKNKNNVLQLADILGHESLDTTRIYTRLNISELRATME